MSFIKLVALKDRCPSFCLLKKKKMFLMNFCSHLTFFKSSILYTGSVVKSQAINVTVLSVESLCHPHVKSSVKLRVLSIHARDGLSDLTLRETPRRLGEVVMEVIVITDGLFSLEFGNNEIYELCLVT